MSKESSPVAEPSAPAEAPREFRSLRASGAPPGVSLAIGTGFRLARDALARRLIRLGATPNHVSTAGFLCTAGAAACLACGASQQAPYFYTGAGPVGWWPLGAALFLILSGACDMLDGAVARLGGMTTRFGAVYDSVLDRCSDFAVFIGCTWNFFCMDSRFFALLALLALLNAFLVSYLKARAENLIPDCSVGYWLRGERFAAMLIACLCGHVPAVLLQQATLPGLTALRRILYTRSVLNAAQADRPLPGTQPPAGWRGRLMLWRHPRGSVGYDIVTGLNIAYIIFAARIWPQVLTVNG